MSRPVKIGLLGCGTVGRGVLALLEKNGALIEERAGLALEVVKVLVRDPGKDRLGVPRGLLTTSAEEVVHGDCDVIVEALGGIEPARSLVVQALEERKHVVTANKALLAAHPLLLRFASEQGVRIGFEATVAAAIPIVRALEEGLVANRVSELLGILNGTCNFVLTRMAEEGESFERALDEARARGFAEADPSLDVDGHDAAQKLAILAGLAFGSAGAPRVEGIRGIEEEDVRAAKALGYALKPLAVAREAGDALDLRVHPAFLPLAHPLASVRFEDNAVLVRGDASGELLLRGKGAGALPTASALLSDVVSVVRGSPATARNEKARPVAQDARSRYYLRFPIHDAPGVIGRIATALGRREISISHAEATLVPGKPGKGHVKILAHETLDSVLATALEDIERLPVLTGNPIAIRIID